VSADGEPIMGRAPGLDNFYLACGFTAGIAASGGAGEAMANWIVNGEPGMDLWPFDVRRFGPLHAQPRYLEARAVESYGAYYKIHWPAEEHRSARGLRRSALYDHLRRAGAVYGSKFGWERPNWFAAQGESAHDRASFEKKPNWFDAVAGEHRAIRERAALIDQSSFAKFEISGKGALAAMNRIAANDLGGLPGKAVYTQLCNEKGGIEADVTIIHLSDELLYLITGAGFGIRDSAWVRRHLPKNGSVVISDVTTRFATINLCGPRSRDVLKSVSGDDVANEAFPFLAARPIALGFATVVAVRIGYVGELGYELYVPQEFAAHVYEVLWQAGETYGIANAGYRAIDSCRMEKGYLYWSGDITPDYNPYEAGLGFAVALGKGDFIGRDALKTISERGITRQLCSLTVEGFAPFHGGEAVFLDARLVGFTASANYGHTLGQSIAFAYLPAEIASAKAFEIEAFGARYHAERGPRCLYDPKMARLKA
jgi:4-methylaminobutanoate oxidase (formaldehyde-forming)